MNSIEANRAIARQFLDFVSEHKLAELCELISPNWRMHGGPPGLSPGPEGLRELFATFGPIEQKWTIEDTIAEGDKSTMYCKDNSNTRLARRCLNSTAAIAFCILGMYIGRI